MKVRGARTYIDARRRLTLKCLHPLAHWRVVLLFMPGYTSVIRSERSRDKYSLRVTGATSVACRFVLGHREEDAICIFV